MRHPDPDTLALLALGEKGEPGARVHVAGCAACQAQVDSFDRVVVAVRASRGEPGLQSPPPHVWDRVAAELGLDVVPDAPVAAGTVSSAEPRSDEQEPSGRHLAVTRPGPEPRARPAARPGSRPGALTGPSGERAPRWRRRTALLVAAGVFLGAAGAVLGDRLLGPDAGSGRVVATADLQPLEGWDEVGSASLEEVDGSRVLSVELPGGAGQGYREVWLIDTALERLVSLGVLTGTEGQFDLPPDLDVSEFAIVDISDEPYDGDPAHSGDSIVRGQLS